VRQLLFAESAVDDGHLVTHGLAISQIGSVQAIADLLGIDPGRVARVLHDLVSTGRARKVHDRFILTPVSRMALESDYSRHYGDLRANADFVAGYEEFERINVDLKDLICKWQTLQVARDVVPNDHSDVEYDQRLLRRLGELHERTDLVLKQLAGRLPRLGIYRDRLRRALGRARDYEIEYVSGVGVESYHTVWFELHEDLLRLMGRVRAEC
jgi:hypothetical protein